MTNVTWNIFCYAINKLNLQKRTTSMTRSLSSWPNLLWLGLYTLNVLAMIPSHGFSIASFARSLGICLIPLMFGIAWNIPQNDVSFLRWLYVVITLIFIIILVMSQAQTIVDAQ